MLNFKRFKFQANDTNRFGKFNSPTLAFSKFTSNKTFVLIFMALIILALFLLYRVLSVGILPSLSTGLDNRAQIPNAKASQTINKEFSFPLKDQEGKEVSKLKVVLESAELRDQIIVKAQRVTAISGRIFLVLNIKITNEYDKTVQMNTRDYFRLSVNKSEKELLAPEIHNDPVEAQASSIKYTKLAFAINDSDKDLKLRVGELTNPDKTVVDLKL